MKQWIVLVAMYWCMTGELLASERLVFSSGSNHPMNHIAAPILRAAYKDLDTQFSVIESTAARALVSANSGETDGVLFRGLVDLERYSNLIKVPVPLGTGSLMVFIRRNESFNVDGWASLRRYRVGSQVGIKAVEQHSEKFDLVLMDKPVQLLVELISGDIDIMILPRLLGMKIVNDHALDKVTMLSNPIDQHPLYHYLHNKNANLVPKVTEALQHMSSSGELEHLRELSEIRLYDPPKHNFEASVIQTASPALPDVT